MTLFFSQIYKMNLLNELNRSPSHLLSRLYSISNYLITSPYFLPSPLCCLVDFNPCKQQVISESSSGDTITVITPNSQVQIYQLNDLQYLYSNYQIGLDRFTNNVIIGLILNNLYPQFSTQYHSISLCHDKGLLESELFNLGPLSNISSLEFFNSAKQRQSIIQYRQESSDDYSNLNIPVQPARATFETLIFEPNLIFTLIKQILIQLAILQDELNFFHSELVVSNIYLNSQPSTLSYNGHSVDSQFSCKIVNFERASLSIILAGQLHRIFNWIWLANALAVNFNIKILTQNSEQYYQLDNYFDYQIYNRIRYKGLPFYPTFDSYVFIISCLLIPEFFYSVFSHSDLFNKLWTPLWFPEDEPIMSQRLAQAIQSSTANTIENIIPLLTGVKLKYNITNILLNNLN